MLHSSFKETSAAVSLLPDAVLDVKLAVPGIQQLKDQLV